MSSEKTAKRNNNPRTTTPSSRTGLESRKPLIRAFLRHALQIEASDYPDRWVLFIGKRVLVPLPGATESFFELH